MLTQCLHTPLIRAISLFRALSRITFHTNATRMNACVPWNEYFVYSEIAQIVWLGSKRVYKTNERNLVSSFTPAIIIVSLTNGWESWQKDDMLVCGAHWRMVIASW